MNEKVNNPKIGPQRRGPQKKDLKNSGASPLGPFGPLCPFAAINAHSRSSGLYAPSGVDKSRLA